MNWENDKASVAYENNLTWDFEMRFKEIIYGLLARLFGG